MTAAAGKKNMTNRKFQMNLSCILCQIGLCILLAIQSACSSSTAAPANQSGPVPVTVTRVITKAMPVEIDAIGNVQTIESVDVKSQVTGQLLKVNFKQGDNVKKGQLLFTIDSRPFVQGVREAQANLEQAHASHNVALANLSNAKAQLLGARSNVLNQRAGVTSAEGNLFSLKAASDDALSLLRKQQTLYSEGVIAERDLEVAQTGYKSAFARYQQAIAQTNQAKVTAVSAEDSGIAQAQATVQQMESQIQVVEAQIQQNEAAVANAKVQLSYCQIRSPIDGQTGNLIVTAGNLVSPSDATALVTINQMAPIYAAFTVPEKNLPDIQRYATSGDLKVVARIDAKTSRNGSLESLDNQINPTTGTVQLRAVFQNDDDALFPGSFVTIVLTLTDQPDAIVIPSQALQTSQQGQFVYVVRSDRTVEVRNVVLDRTIGNEAVISNGLNAGETIVTDGQLRVSPGAQVQVVTPSNSPNSSSSANSAAAGNSNGGAP